MGNTDGVLLLMEEYILEQTKRSSESPLTE